jgi:acetylglutamate/LysW-gamma-L-alpha-aminoadipate kinase
MMIVKIGGGAEIDLEAAADDLALLEEEVVVVLGANALRKRFAEALGKPVKTITSLSGYTSVFSDDDTIDLLMLAYAGLRCKRMVELLQRRGVNAVGLSGLDGRLVEGRRNRGIRTMQGDKKVFLRDRSGKPKGLNRSLLRFLLDGGYMPVLTVPIADEEGFAVNTENDEIVALLHEKLGADCVVHLIEAPGLLKDRSDPETVLTRLSPSELEAWEQGAEGRMKRKIRSLNKLFAAGSPVVHLSDGRVTEPIKKALKGEGTLIR